MTDVEMLRAALVIACRELVLREKYRGELPDNSPPLTDSEDRAASATYDRLLDLALAQPSRSK